MADQSPATDGVSSSTTTTTTAHLPRWDMTPIFPSLQSSEFEQGFRDTAAQIEALAALFDAEGVGNEVARREPAALTSATVTSFERVVARLNAVLEQFHTLSAYISSFVSTDSRDTLAQAKFSELQQHAVRLSLLDTRFSAWIGSLDVDALLAASQAARDCEYALRLAQVEAAHQMSPAEEALAAELNVSGGSSWSKLHGNVTSQLSVPVTLPSGTRELPMSAVRNLAYDGDREVRRLAYEAELAGWEQVAVPLSGALNSIKGQVNTLARHRGWESALDAALFDAHIDRATLDAMMEAARASFPDFRRYLKAKARALGEASLAWYDLFAPVGSGEKSWSFDESRAFIVEQFATYSPRLSDFAARAFRERWIDAAPRPGKRDGAFCMWVRGDESRVMANFKPAFPGMSTLAHELGHGYHNFNLAGKHMLQRQTPMTLAETASIFCETIVREAALTGADAAEQLGILEASLQGSCQVVVDITSRFLFEQGVFERRQQRELAVDELNVLMLDSQRATYGDGLDAALLHPYMWAVKTHYYSPGRSYYNFPYMFGLLFGLGLYARYRQDPAEFRKSYDALLASTGLADAATLAGRFGIELRTPAFWTASLDLVRADIARFESLVEGQQSRS